MKVGESKSIRGDDFYSRCHTKSVSLLVQRGSALLHIQREAALHRERCFFSPQGSTSPPHIDGWLSCGRRIPHKLVIGTLIAAERSASSSEYISRSDINPSAVPAQDGSQATMITGPLPRVKSQA